MLKPPDVQQATPDDRAALSHVGTHPCGQPVGCLVRIDKHIDQEATAQAPVHGWGHVTTVSRPDDPALGRRSGAHSKDGMACAVARAPGAASSFAVPRVQEGRLITTMNLIGLGFILPVFVVSLASQWEIAIRN